MLNQFRVTEAICALQESWQGDALLTKLGVNDLVLASAPARPSGLIEVTVRGETYTILFRDLIRNSTRCEKANCAVH